MSVETQTVKWTTRQISTSKRKWMGKSISWFFVIEVSDFARNSHPVPSAQNEFKKKWIDVREYNFPFRFRVSSWITALYYRRARALTS